MGKVAFLFAGQGAQYPGIGESLSNASAAAKAVFDTADAVRPGTSTQCFSGTKEELTQTHNTQPCVYCVDLAAARALEEAGVHADGVAGFSLGEVAALTFAGAFASDEAGFSLVIERGRLMEQANDRHPGAMAAVLKLKNEEVEAICAKFEHIWPVNYNCPGQLVAAGEREEIDPFCKAVSEAGGRAKKLAVGGGFHSPLMHEASASLEAVLEKMEMHQPRIPVYANFTSKPDAEPFKATLARQMENPVRWQQTISQMMEDGFDTFIEVGPGKTLSGLVKRIAPDAKILRVEDAQMLSDAVAACKA